jgi:hypothetical protein
VAFRLFDAASEDVVGDRGLARNALLEKVPKAAGEMQLRLLRDVAVRPQKRLGAGPTDGHAAEEVGLGTRHAEQAGRLEGGALAEDLGIGTEPDLGAAPVLDRPKVLERPVGESALVALPVELLPARHLDLQSLR